MKNKFLPIFIGLVSGICSFFSLNISFIIWPGVLFGIGLCVYFFLSNKQLSIDKAVLFIITSGLSYTAAFYVTVFTLKLAPQNIVGLAFGGIIGGFLLGCSIKYFLLPLKWKECLYLAIFSAVLAQSFEFGIRIGRYESGFLDLPSPASLLTLFIVWQAGMLYAIARLVARSKIKKK